MSKSITMRIIASLLLIILMANVSPVAFAAGENTASVVGCSNYADEKNPDGEECDQTEQVRLTVWGTFAEAQRYYGYDWLYVIVGFNEALGYFECYYMMTDGTRNDFGCYSL